MLAPPHASIRALLYAWLSAADVVLICVFIPVFSIYYALMVSIVLKSKRCPELRDDHGLPLTFMALGNPSTIGMLFKREVLDAQTATLLRRARTALIAVIALVFGLIVLSLGWSALAAF